MINRDGICVCPECRYRVKLFDLVNLDLVEVCFENVEAEVPCPACCAVYVIEVNTTIEITTKKKEN